MPLINTRVFDCIAARPGSTLKDVRNELWQIDPSSLRHALERLRVGGFLELERNGRFFAYTVSGNQRPVDGRGGDHRKPSPANVPAVGHLNGRPA